MAKKNPDIRMESSATRWTLSFEERKRIEASLEALKLNRPVQITELLLVSVRIVPSTEKLDMVVETLTINWGVIPIAVQGNYYIVLVLIPFLIYTWNNI